MITICLASIILLLIGSLGTLAVLAAPRAASQLGAGTAVVASVVGIVPAVAVLLSGNASSIRFAWGAYGSIYLEIDALSGFFLVPIFLLAGLGAIYGSAYLGDDPRARRTAASWCLFDLLVASMALVVLARNGLVFLVAWEAMALTSFFLVLFDHEKASAREAGFTYLVASHLGTALLFPFFLILGHAAGSLDFDAFRAHLPAGPASAGLLFVLALIGFGTKAGIVPVHVWLPEAHPAAPSHVSALMSGVMIKTGIYGILRALTFLGPPPAWWGATLVGVGVVSGVLGVLFALAQHDLKRLLAYHSVENIGIIVMGLGLGLLGVSTGLPALAVLGFAGGLLHVVNHALFKGLLFLCAGSVLHATSTAEMDHLGGLAKKMPWTAATFLVGAAAISGLPPLNGFISEILVYLGAFHGCGAPGLLTAIPALAAAVGLALIGGLAAACFSKAFGCVFLGEPRGEHGQHAHDPGLAMRGPMALMAAACLAIGLSAPWAVRLVEAPIRSLVSFSPAAVAAEVSGACAILSCVVGGTLALVALIAAIAALRARLLRGREVTERVTWDCGYARPTVRMQYTSSSFADPIVRMFGSILGTHRSITAPEGYFPTEARAETHTPDLFRERLFEPAFLVVRMSLKGLRWLQLGGVHLYVLYVALTLIVLLIWKL